MKLLFGTGNQAKLSVMRNRLEKIGIELIGLCDLEADGKSIPEVLETGNTPLENARLKALAYYKAFQMPVFSCDSGLYFDNIPDEIQPGVHVRNVNGKCLSDEEMTKYYTGLAKKYGNLVAQYRNAICFVMDEKHIYEAMEDSLYSEKFIITDKPHSTVRKKGFPLDNISIDMKTNKYYYDLTDDELEQFAVEDGVLRFFEDILGLEGSMTRVYFVRHAQPEHSWKEDRTRPLTEEGKKDSAIVLEFLKDKKIDAFYCSPYKRSMDTIADAAQFFGKEIITDERLREREKGHDGNNHGMFQKRWADHDYHEEGGESIAMVQKRNMEALNQILADNAGKEVVVGTHGTALSTILSFFDNSFGCEDFLRIIDWMPYIIELDFEGHELVGKHEHCHVEKEFKGN